MKPEPAERSESLRRLLSVKEAGTVLGLGQWRVRTLVWRMEIPFVRIGRRIMIDIKDLENFIQANKTAAMKT
jgi:excisionase family DNA binding protein